MIRSRVGRLAASGMAAVMVCAAVPLLGHDRTAAAEPPGAGYSYASAAKVSPGGGLTATVEATGLLGFLSPVLSGVVNPLASTLTGLPNRLVAGVAQGLTTAGLDATSSSSAHGAPSVGFPACGAGPWTVSNCFAMPLNIGAAPLVSIGTNTTHGYATGDASGYTARSQVAHPVISLLGIPIGDLGLLDARASCPADGDPCTTAQSVSGEPAPQGISLLGGLVTASAADSSGALSVTVAEQSLADGFSKTITTGINQFGLNMVQVALDRNLLTVRLGIGVSQLLAGLGLGGLLAGVAGLTTHGSNAFLTVTLGPGSSVDGATSSQAWGLDVGIDLSATIALGVGLLGATISIPSGIDGTRNGNLLNLKLAYADAYSGTAPGQQRQWVPPGLI